MRVSGPRPLDSESAECVYGRIFFDLQKIVVADLRLALADDRIDRAIMGAVVAQRVLLEAFPKHFAPACHTEDFIEWKQQYLEWFDANAKRIRMKKADRESMRQQAVDEFDRIIELSSSKTFRCAQRLEAAGDKTAWLPYRGEDGRFIEVPPLD